jgi:hypothetical protein
MRINKAQGAALAKLYARIEKPEFSFLSFRRKAGRMIGGDGALVVPWCGMFIAIEPDGYCHS